MNELEAGQQAKRIENFNVLKAKLRLRLAAFGAVINDDPTGPCGKGPFTGNTRESRHVNELTIEFSFTEGGSLPVTLTLKGLGISAPEFGRFLEDALRAEICEIKKEMESI